ncbi:hypothetical protein D8674_028890 [Pyrus ussuriensis x Pyrus communis]|uniref:Uncharacterized protein n=1 Tax=Pyrus ussuriensis x Pyrus communis TaxID=2448454 RepID=A0A5N5I0L9_9ROSA|nr:hypothetical protein D8674_028890 [Pyrus ussuriensis x Pyrus communis]
MGPNDRLPCQQAEGFQNTYFGDHSRHNWFVLEFIDEDEVEYVLQGHHGYDLKLFMVNKMFGDDLNLMPDEGVKGLGLALPDTEDDLIF